MCPHCDLFLVYEVLHIVFQLHAPKSGVSFHTMEFTKLVVFVPRGLGLALIHLLHLWISDKVSFRQFLKDDIKWFTYGSIDSRCLLEFGFLSYSDVDGIGLVGRSLKIGHWCVVLIVFLWGLLVIRIFFGQPVRGSNPIVSLPFTKFGANQL